VLPAGEHAAPCGAAALAGTPRRERSPARRSAEPNWGLKASTPTPLTRSAIAISRVEFSAGRRSLISWVRTSPPGLQEGDPLGQRGVQLRCGYTGPFRGHRQQPDACSEEEPGIVLGAWLLPANRRYGSEAILPSLPRR